MPRDLRDLGIDQLNLEDRLALVQAIWDSIADMAERPPLSQATRQELDRRLADHLANPEDVIAWEQVEAEALARSKR